MKFELDDALIDDILFHMENQDGIFYLDTKKGYVVNPEGNLRSLQLARRRIPDFDEGEEDEEDKDDENEADNKDRYIDLPQWSSNDGYRLMERFAAEFKNPIVRHELSNALNRNKGVFRAFKDVLEQYPEAEKHWYSYKDKKMKEEVIDWYNALREEWGLEPIGSEPEDTSSLVLEDFTIRQDNSCCENSLCIIAENSERESCACICAVKENDSYYIKKLEVEPEYRGMGLGKTLLAKFLEKADDREITIEVPKEADFFTRSLLLEGFELFSQKFIKR